MRVRIAALVLLLALVPSAAGALPCKAKLTAATHTPTINTKWRYSVRVTNLKGQAITAKVTVQIVDPLGGVHPVEFGNRKVNDQGSIYIGSEGVLYSPYIAAPVLLPAERFRNYKLPTPGAQNHYLQFVEACRGNGKTSAPFDYSGPLTEMVLLGCLATRFPKKTLEWEPKVALEDGLRETIDYFKRTLAS